MVRDKDFGGKQMKNYHISQEDDASSEDKTAVRRGLAAYNLSHFGYDDGKPINFFLRDEEGEIVGGLLGHTYWDFLAVDIFWLDESVRGQGLGEKILKMAEVEAVRRGCTTAHLDTFEFQAPRFYEKYGYEKWGELDGYAGRFKRIYYKKSLK
jgi:GNAT superfamily N-acetyltransferase